MFACIRDGILLDISEETVREISKEIDEEIFKKRIGIFSETKKKPEEILISVKNYGGYYQEFVWLICRKTSWEIHGEINEGINGQISNAIHGSFSIFIILFKYFWRIFSNECLNTLKPREFLW